MAERRRDRAGMSAPRATTRTNTHATDPRMLFIGAARRGRR